TLKSPSYTKSVSWQHYLPSGPNSVWLVIRRMGCGEAVL
ncbi:transposase, partial [Shigella flexneri]